MAHTSIKEMSGHETLRRLLGRAPLTHYRPHTFTGQLHNAHYGLGEQQRWQWEVPSPHTPMVGPRRHFSSWAVGPATPPAPPCPQGSSLKSALCLCQHRCLLQRLRVRGLGEAAVGINFCLQSGLIEDPALYTTFEAGPGLPRRA